MLKYIKRPLLPFSASAFLVLFSLIALIRIFAAWLLPLVDQSESRYAEIARKMVETGDWITLYHDYGVPFWAKPPLSTWLSAIGISWFGLNAFAARIPVLFTSLIIVWLVMRLAKSRAQEDLGKISALILFSSCFYFFLSAAVMTDMALVLGTTLAMVAFWLALKPESSAVWKYLFFVGLAIGLLAKGLVAIVMIWIPLLLWSLISSSLKELWYKFPWVLGTILMLAIAAPWFILAEYKTPGFMNYFFIGEHFNRFLVKGWAGDLYGRAHSRPLGSIWPYWFASCFPWSLWLFGLVVINFRRLKEMFSSSDGWVLYLSLWALAPMLLFTFSQNIIPTYPLPSLPASALLIGHLIMQIDKTWTRPTFLVSVMTVPVVTFAIIIYIQTVDPYIIFSQKNLVECYDSTFKTKDSKLVVYCRGCYSARFYSNGTALLVTENNELQKIFDKDGELFVAMQEGVFATLPEHVRDRLVEVQRFDSMIMYKKMNGV